MKTRTTVVLTVIAAGVVAAVGAAIVIATGAYNVAATSPHSAPVESILGTMADRSVAARAGGLTPPAEALDAKGKVGYQGYDDYLCVMCHGAPGVEPTAIGKGLYPRPPALWKESDETLAEDYWIIANGIKDTGMPAFKARIKEKDLWLIASFVKRLNGMSAGEYQSLGSGG